MHRRTFLAVALAFTFHALGGEVPSADELFARLRERAQRLDGLRCTLEVERERNPLRQQLEFRSPGHLRLENLPASDVPWRREWLRQTAVLTPAERWTHVAWRDELVTGPPDSESLWEFRPEERPNDGWEGTARLFAALLAPDAFYRDYEIRRVFPDTLAGRPCWLVLLAGKAVAPERLWIDAERWTPLRLQVTAWTEWRRTMHHTLTVAHQREIAPGLWLPAEVWDERREYHRYVHHKAPFPMPEGFERLFLTAGRLIEAKLGEAPGDERFRPPADAPLVRRPAAMGNAHFEWKANPPFRHRIPQALLAPAEAESEHALPRLRRFVANNPRIRAGYHELEPMIHYFVKREEWEAPLRQLREAAAAARPDDPYFQWQVAHALFYDAPTLENAEKLAPFVGPGFARRVLEIRLKAQVEAGDHAAARRTAHEAIQLLAGWDDEYPIPFGPVFEAAAKGQWLAQLRADAERHAEADPPSEIHLRLLKALAAREKDWPRYKALGERLDDVHRDALAFQVESAHALGGDDRLRALDCLSEGHFLPRAQALWSLECQHRREANQHGVSHILKELQDDFKARWRDMTKLQLLWRHRLLASWRERHPETALMDLRLAVWWAPEDEALKFRLLECLLRTPHAAEALRLFDRLRGAHPGRPELWLAAARALPAKEHPERARQIIEGLSLAAPTEPSAAEAARRLCSEMGLFEEAARWVVEEALRRRPNVEVELELRTEAALLLIRAKQAERAVETWLGGVRETLRQPMIAERRPRLIAGQVARLAAPALLTEADKEWVAQRWLPALEAAAKQLSRDSPAAERAAIEFPLAAAHRALGDHAKAAQHYARGLKLLPNFAEGRKWLDEIAPNYPLNDF